MQVLLSNRFFRVITTRGDLFFYVRTCQIRKDEEGSELHSFCLSLSGRIQVREKPPRSMNRESYPHLTFWRIRHKQPLADELPQKVPAGSFFETGSLDNLSPRHFT